MPPKKITIQITDQRFPAFMRRIVSCLAIIILPISVGIFRDSAALQWVGFVMTFFFLIAVGTWVMKKETSYSIAEARAYLDKLEREG